LITLDSTDVSSLYAVAVNGYGVYRWWQVFCLNLFHLFISWWLGLCEELDMLRLCLRLGRLQDSNAVLSHYNEFAENCFSDVSLEFARSTRLLKSMKADLDYIFLKLRYAIPFLTLSSLGSSYVAHDLFHASGALKVRFWLRIQTHFQMILLVMLLIDGPISSCLNKHSEHSDVYASRP
jgi:hypothetical protein